MMQQMLLGHGGGSSLDMSTLYATKVYTGNGSTQSINNGLDLTTGEALVLIKRLTENDVQTDPTVFDTVQGANKHHNTNRGNGLETTTDRLTSFNNNGFSLGSAEEINRSGKQLVSHTFKSEPTFFDIVSYTGNGTIGRTVSHNLGAEPGCIIWKNAGSLGFGWTVYHTGMGTNASAVLESDAAATSSVTNNTAPTSTQFTLSNSSRNNRNGDPIIAYLFAKDTANVIKCDSYTGNGTSQSINLGFEPQWLMIKETTDTGPWQVYDNVRTFDMSAGNGLPAGSRHSYIALNSSAAQVAAATAVHFTSTGFDLGDSSRANTNSQNYIYVAIAAP
jgi:hypothetical protein|tara:strand:- start:359 stop:1357 length:999 start_codon:yes stop_codon:yes gene_type:complete